MIIIMEANAWGDIDTDDDDDDENICGLLRAPWSGSETMPEKVFSLRKRYDQPHCRTDRPKKINVNFCSK